MVTPGVVRRGVVRDERATAGERATARVAPTRTAARQICCYSVWTLLRSGWSMKRRPRRLLCAGRVNSW